MQPPPGCRGAFLQPSPNAQGAPVLASSRDPESCLRGSAGDARSRSGRRPRGGSRSPLPTYPAAQPAAAAAVLGPAPSSRDAESRGGAGSGLSRPRGPGWAAVLCPGVGERAGVCCGVSGRGLGPGF